MMIAGAIDGRNLSPEEAAAYDAPFPDPSFKMGPRAMPRQVPTLPDDPSIAANRAAWNTLGHTTTPVAAALGPVDPTVAPGLRIVYGVAIPAAGNRGAARKRLGFRVSGKTSPGLGDLGGELRCR